MEGIATPTNLGRQHAEAAAAILSVVRENVYRLAETPDALTQLLTMAREDLATAMRWVNEAIMAAKR